MNDLFAHKKFNLIAFGIIAGMVLIAYSNTFHAAFHFDDVPSITDNYNIKRVSMDGVISILKGIRPMVYLSLMLNYSLGGLNVTGYHIFNVGCHIITAFLVYLLIVTTLGLPVFKEKYRGRAKRMALFGALIFAVHPVQTESVTYIISRTELLATLFYLAALLMFIQAVLKRKALYLAGLLFFSLCSMMSKEWAVTLPAVLMLYDYLFLSDRNVKTVASHWLLFVLAALPLAAIAHTLNLFSNPSIGFNMKPSSPGGVARTPYTYLLTSFSVLWTYVRLLILPIQQNLDYEYPIATSLFELPTILAFLGHVAVVAAMFWLYKKRGWLLIPFGIAWFYITISPVQSFVPVMDIIFEHRLYVPSIGLIFAFVVALEQVFIRQEAQKAAEKSGAA